MEEKNNVKQLNYLKKYLNNNDLLDAIKRLENGEAVQYIIGNVSFYGNTIEIDKNVLIPRFETELLVEKTIKYAKEIFLGKIDILDIGTGSGAIAITLAKELNCNMTASDISKEALKVARKNAKNNNVDIKFVYSNVFTCIKGTYDIIISNPPYIAYDEEIMDVVKNNEPHIALYADNNGLYYYEKILKESTKYLKNKFLIAFEIGYLQRDAVIDIANKYLKNIKVWCEKDYSNKDRFIFIKNN